MWTRRAFLVQGVGGAIGMAAAKAPWPRSLSSPRVTAAIVGLGRRGHRHLAAALLPNVSLAMICDRDRHAIADARTRLTAWGTAPPLDTSDYRRILDRSDVDVVIVAAPASARTRIIADALSAGKHLYIEPPWSSSVEDSARLREAADASGRLVWQGQAEPSWDAMTVSRELGDCLAADGMETRVSMFRSSFDDHDGAALGRGTDGSITIERRLRGWFDPLIWIAGNVAPGQPSARHLGVSLPFGRRDTFDVVPPAPASLRLTMHQDSNPATRGEEWRIAVRRRGGEREITIAYDDHQALRPVPQQDLTCLAPFLAALQGRDMSTWRRAHARAHTVLHWFDTMVQAARQT